MSGLGVRLQTAFPDGAQFYRRDDGELCMTWSFDDPGVDRLVPEPIPGYYELHRIERHMLVSEWVDENTISGTSYDVVETGAGEIVTVLLSLPGGGISSGLSVGRRFILVRHEDVSTVSGTGVVAQGVQFPDGSVALRWCCPGLPPSTAVWDSVEAVIAVHGHQGKTEIEWVD